MPGKSNCQQCGSLNNNFAEQYRTPITLRAGSPVRKAIGLSEASLRGVDGTLRWMQDSIQILGGNVRSSWKWEQAWNDSCKALQRAVRFFVPRGLDCTLVGGAVRCMQGTSRGGFWIIRSFTRRSRTQSLYVGSNCKSFQLRIYCCSARQISSCCPSLK